MSIIQEAGGSDVLAQWGRESIVVVCGLNELHKAASSSSIMTLTLQLIIKYRSSSLRQVE